MRKAPCRVREQLYDRLSDKLVEIEKKLPKEISNENDVSEYIEVMNGIREVGFEIETIKDITFLDWKNLYNRVANQINRGLREESRNRIELIK